MIVFLLISRGAEEDIQVIASYGHTNAASCLSLLRDVRNWWPFLSSVVTSTVLPQDSHDRSNASSHQRTTRPFLQEFPLQKLPDHKQALQ